MEIFEEFPYNEIVSINYFSYNIILIIIIILCMYVWGMIHFAKGIFFNVYEDSEEE